MSATTGSIRRSGTKRTAARGAEPPKLRRNGNDNHASAMWWSAELTDWWRRMWRPDAMRIDPHDVIKLLNRAEVGFVLMGAHAMAGWFGEPRATRDVDVLVRKAHHRKAMRAIIEAYPQLTVRDLPFVTRFIDPADDKAVIDLMKPVHPVHAAVFKRTILIARSHRIPDLEMALATKFAAMVSPHREVLRKQQDAVDFGVIVQQHNPKIDREKLHELGELVYNGGGDEVLQFVDDILAGRSIRL